jgi:hypothetical protein
MPAYQPANLARDPIGSREGRRKYDEQREKESGAPEHAGHHKSLGEALFGRHEAQVASNGQASKKKRKPTHTARSTSEYAAHQPSARPAREERQNPERVPGAVDHVPQRLNEARQAAATGRKR